MASQTITGKDLQYTQDNKHCFAYSGAVATDNTETVLLEGAFGAGYLVGTWATYYHTQTTDDYRFRLYFNNQIVAVIQWDQSEHPQGRNLNVSDIIVPPNILLKLTAQNVADTTSNEVAASLTGRVYEYLPVRN